MSSKPIGDGFRDVLSGALLAIRKGYNNDLRFSTNINGYNEITVQYGYPSSKEITVLRISQSELSMNIKVDESLKSSVQPQTLQWSSASESDIANAIKTMYESVLTENKWSISGPLTPRLDTINVRTEPVHGMDNPITKIAALDVEIKRSRNKLKYMEAQLFPVGTPSGKSSGH